MAPGERASPASHAAATGGCGGLPAGARGAGPKGEAQALLRGECVGFGARERLAGAALSLGWVGGRGGEGQRHLGALCVPPQELGGGASLPAQQNVGVRLPQRSDCPATRRLSQGLRSCWVRSPLSCRPLAGKAGRKERGPEPRPGQKQLGLGRAGPTRRRRPLTQRVEREGELSGTAPACCPHPVTSLEGGPILFWRRKGWRGAAAAASSLVAGWQTAGRKLAPCWPLEHVVEPAMLEHPSAGLYPEVAKALSEVR